MRVLTYGKSLDVTSFIQEARAKYAPVEIHNTRSASWLSRETIELRFQRACIRRGIVSARRFHKRKLLCIFWLAWKHGVVCDPVREADSKERHNIDCSIAYALQCLHALSNRIRSCIKRDRVDHINNVLCRIAQASEEHYFRTAYSELKKLRKRTQRKPQQPQLVGTRFHMSFTEIVQLTAGAHPHAQAHTMTHACFPRACLACPTN